LRRRSRVTWRSRTASGNWHGPYADLGIAENVAKRTDQPDIRGCDLCIASESSLVIDAKPIEKPPSQADSSTEPLHLWDKELSHACSLRLSWSPTGKIVFDEAGKLHFPKVESTPGIYRLRTRGKQGNSSLYIGETDDLSRRFGNYRNPGPTQQTSLRINRFLVELLSAGGEASISLAKTVTIEATGRSLVVDLADKNIRRMFESLAIVLEQATEIEQLNR
jgi:hypothetical protein